MTDEQLREAYRRAVDARAREAGERSACPPPEALEALVERTGTEAQRLRTLDHVMACASCRPEFELLRSIGAAHLRAAPARRRPTWQRPLTLALAASVMFAVVLGPGRSVWNDWRSDAVRSGGPGIVLAQPADGATAGAEPLRFTWRPAGGATSYTLEIMTSEGSVRHAATTRDTTTVVSEIMSLPPGDYRWWVRTRTAGGELRSELQAITVRR